MAMDLPKGQSKKNAGNKSSESSSRHRSHKTSNETRDQKIIFKDQKKHRSVLKKRGVPDGLELNYIYKGKKLLEGYTKGGGIYCNCCNEVVSPTMFESHAGRPSTKKPYQHIFLLDGLSLHQYASSLKLNREKNKKTVENDDLLNGLSLHEFASSLKLNGENNKKVVEDNDLLCMACHKSGDLLFCEGCPRSFHEECILGSSTNTITTFSKRFCNKCQISLSVEDQRVFKVGPPEETVKEYLEVIPPEETVKECLEVIDNLCELIACVLCRSCDFVADGFCDQTSIVCDQCEKEYHIGCLREYMDIDLRELPAGNWFCSTDCASLRSLIDFVTSPPLILPESYMEVVKKKLKSKDYENIMNHDRKWIVIKGKDACEEEKMFLTQAVDIFHNCFNPIVDAVTEKDFITSMVYGEQMGSSNFSGVYSALLIIDSIVITAGMFRILGREIAELPIIATSQACQGTGYLQAFLACFERLLAILRVKKIVILATDDAKTMWIKKFGFSEVNQEMLNEYRQTHTSMVAFQGTTMLERNVNQGLLNFKR